MADALDRRWAEVAALLDALADVAPAARTAWLAERGVDAELAALTQRLLAADADVGADLEHAAADLRDWASVDAEPTAPHIAGYRVLRFLGAGGMASVFLAERALEGSVQRVALKLLRTNVHDPRERALFRREQAALARLDHPHIARLIDAGFAADGAPWIAVEFVAGTTLLDHCDTHRLDLRQRARLFLDVCTAVAAAHQALVVHRDLKPGNVLVTPAGAVRLVDFGIAKLLEGDEAATRTELRRLTPGYAAPEQYRGENTGTASDVYALGVMLAELATGQRPQPRADGTSAAPSTQPITAQTAAQRGTDVVSLKRSLRGDLDAIVARALRPEPRERYASVEALAADVQAWLQYRPVSARRGTRRYRASRFVRRHGALLALATAAGLALLATAGLALREAQRARVSATEARDQAQRARRVQDFMLGMFRSDENGVPAGSARSAEELVERALGLARHEFEHEPDALIATLTALGDVDRGLGRLEQSRAALEEAAALALAHAGPGATATLQAESELAHTRYRAGDYAAADARLQRAIDAFRAAGGGDSEALMSALSRLGQIQESLGDFPRSLALQRESVAIGERVLGPDHPRVQRALEMLGAAQMMDGDVATARATLQRNLALAERLYGRQHLSVASALETLAGLELRTGRHEAAVPLLREAVAISAQTAPNANTIAAYCYNTLGVTLLYLGRPAAAQAQFERAWAIYAAMHTGAHPMLVATLDNLGRAAFERGEPSRAAEHFHKARDMSVAARGGPDLHSVQLGCSAAAAELEAGAVAAARATWERAQAELAPLTRVDPDLAAECATTQARIALATGAEARAMEVAAKLLADPAPDPFVSLLGAARVAMRSPDAALRRTALRAALRDNASTLPLHALADWAVLEDAAAALDPALAAAVHLRRSALATRVAAAAVYDAAPARQ